VVEVQCPRCNRRGRYRKARLIESYGTDLSLPDLLRELSPDCPVRSEFKNQACGAIYLALANRGNIQLTEKGEALCERYSARWRLLR